MSDRAHSSEIRAARLLSSRRPALRSTIVGSPDNMKLVADIHLHSHYSRATSRNLTLEHLWKWAQLKGVQVVATGDIAHPGWLAELREKLEPAEAGLFRLKGEHTAGLADQVPAACRGTVRFLIGGEISNIYKKYDRTRKVHNIVFSPSFEATARLQAELEKIGNIRSDGRPDPGARQPRPAGDRAAGGSALPPDPRPHLDPLVLDARLQVGVRFGARVLRRPHAPHLRRGDRSLLRSADELARLLARRLHAYLQLRRPFAAKAGARGDLLRHRAELRRPVRRAAQWRPGTLSGHHRVLSRGGQVPPGRASQVRRLLGAGDHARPRRTLLRLRQAGDGGGVPPHGGAGRPADRGRVPPAPGPSPVSSRCRKRWGRCSAWVPVPSACSASTCACWSGWGRS